MNTARRVLDRTTVQGLLALILVGGVVVAYLIGRPIPPRAVDMVLIVLGFYFGSVTSAYERDRSEQRNR